MDVIVRYELNLFDWELDEWDMQSNFVRNNEIYWGLKKHSRMEWDEKDCPTKMAFSPKYRLGRIKFNV